MLDLTIAAGIAKTNSALSGFLESIGNTTDGVYVIDETFRIILWNDAAEQILGYSAGEVLGKPCYEVFAGRDEKGNLVCHAGCVDMALATSGSLAPTHTVLARTKDGNPVWLNVTNILAPSESGGFAVIAHIFREVTANKNMEQVMERMASLMKGYANLRAARSGNTGETPVRREPLTSRERQVLRLLAEGSNSTSIARSLVISPATARKHIQNIFKKLSVHTTLEAVAYASRNNLLSS